MLRIMNVWFRYSRKSDYVLRNINLNLNKGEVLAIIGPNGSGKTTLLMIAGGLIKPERGEVFFNDKPLMKQIPEARRRIGILFQDPNDQLFNPTVYDEIAFALRQLKYSEDEVKLAVYEIAEQFNIKELLNRPPYKLSEGEKKIVALASILIYRPELLLLDEPTSNISSKYIDKIENLIMEMKSENKAVIITSHNLDFIASIADRICLINKGEIIAEGETSEILFNEEALRKVELKPPLIIQISKALNLSLNGKPPLTLDELIMAFKNKLKNCT